MRVLLDQLSLKEGKPLTISTTGDHLMLMHMGSVKRRVSKQSIVVTHKRGQLYIDGRRYRPQECAITTFGGHLQYNNRSYDGSFQLLLHNDSLLVINKVPLEAYICSVLHSESWPGWPLEVNKVFAVACRSYVLSMIAQAIKQEQPYDVCNTNLHQTYAGKHDKKVLKDAVAQTKGVVLVHEGKPIRAMFDSCCGGVIPAHIADVHFPDAPYLARDYPCTHCKDLWIYSWQAEFTPQQLHEKLLAKIGHRMRISDLLVSKRDKAGLVQEVLVHGATPVPVAGKELYTLCKEIKSFCYTIERKKDTILLKGKGYGHHLGLCQWGARQMVADHWDYRRILHFYYPQTKLMRFV